MNWLEDFRKDLKYAVRSLGANPLFATVAILTLALGIGANAAIFSVINAVVLRTLPVRDPQRLFYLRCDGSPNGANNTGNFDSSFSEPVFQRMRADKAGVLRRDGLRSAGLEQNCRAGGQSARRSIDRNGERQFFQRVGRTFPVRAASNGS